MKNKIIIIGISVLIIVALFFISTGLKKRKDVVLTNYAVSDEGDIITLNVAVSSSAGYVRGMKVKQGGDNYYITFYPTFGINNKIGAQNEFDLEITQNCDEIYFYHGDGGYDLVLKKDKETGEWNIVVDEEKIEE